MNEARNISRPRERSRWLARWRRNLVLCVAAGSIALVAFVLSLLGVLAVVLLTPEGTHWGLSKGLAFYNRWMWGHATIGMIQGSLAHGLTLDHVRLADRFDQPLVDAEQLHLELDLASLWRGNVTVSCLEIDGVQVHLRDTEHGGFADLGPREPSPSDPKSGYGPDLPFELMANVRVSDGQIRRTTDGADSTFLDVPELELELQAHGRDASARLNGAASLPHSNLDVHWLAAHAHWSEPRAHLSSLLVQSNAGEVVAHDIEFDAMQAWVAVDALQATPNPQWLAQYHDVTLAPGTDFAVSLEGGGYLDDFSMEIVSRGSGIGYVAGSVHGRLDPETDLQLWLDAGLDGTYSPREGQLAPLKIDGWARAIGSVQAGADLALSLTCFGCVRELDPLTLRAEGFAGTETKQQQIHARIDAPQVRGRFDVRTDTDGSLTANSKIDVPKLASLQPLIDRLRPGLSLQGHLETNVHCRGKLDAERGNCRTKLSLRDGAPVDRLEFDATTSFRGREKLTVTVDELEAQRDSVRVQLETPGATVTYEPDALTIERVALAVSTASGRGSIRVHGRTTLGNTRIANAHLEVQRFDLAALDQIAPSLHARGRLDATIDVQGPWAKPTMSGTVRTRRVKLADLELGHVRIESSYRQQQLKTTLSLSHGKIGKFDGKLQLPLAIDLQRGTIAPKWQEPVELVLDGEAIPLSVARKVAPRFAELEGQLDVHLAVGQTLHSPRVSLQADAKRVRLRRHILPNVELDATYDDAVVAAKLAASHPAAFAELNLTAAVPLELDLQRRRVHWERQHEHRVDLRLRRYNLKNLSRYNESLVAGGHVDVTLQAHGTVDHPHLDARVRGEKLVYRSAALDQLDVTVRAEGPAQAPHIRVHGQLHDARFDHREVGDVRLASRYEDAQVHATAEWKRSPQHRVHIEAEIPLALDLRNAKFHWPRDHPHRVEIEANRIDRALLESFVDAPRFDIVTALRAEAKGTLDDFLVVASLPGHITSQDRSHRLRIDVRAEPRRQTLRLTVGPRHARVAELVARTSANVRALRQGQSWKHTPVDVQAHVDRLAIESFGVFAPATVQDIVGELSAKGKVAGTLGAPRWRGSVRLHRGGVTVVPARQRFEAIELVARLDEDRLDLDKLSVSAGNGSAHARGHVNFVESSTRQGAIELDIDRMPVQMPGWPRLAVSGTARTTLDWSPQALGVDIEFADGRADVSTTRIAAPRPIPHSDRIEYVDGSPPTNESASTDQPVDESIAPDSSPTPLHLSFALVDPLLIVGNGVDMQWDGAISTRGRPGQTSTTGALSTEHGSFELFGNSFEITSGAVTFPKQGSTPFVDITATTAVEDVQIQAVARGPISRPELTLSSSPPLSQSEIFTALVTGTTDGSQAESDDVEAKAAAVLAAVANSALQQQLRTRLHVDRVGLGFGDTTDQPILSVGKNLTRRLYTEMKYHHNAPKDHNQAQLEIDYRFAPRWSIETFFGDAAAGGVDLLWGFTFDSDAPAELAETHSSHTCADVPQNSNLECSE